MYEDYALIPKADLTALADAIRNRLGHQVNLRPQDMTGMIGDFLPCDRNYSTEGLVFTAVTGGWSVTGYNGTDSNVYIGSHHNDLPIIKIGNKAFYQNPIITTLSFAVDSQVTDIGTYAFSECPNLITAILPDNATRFGDRLLTKCPKLAILVLPKKSPAVNSWGLAYTCPKLKTVVFPENPTVIYDASFQSSGLDNIIIPPTVTTLKSQCFGWMPNLNKIYIPKSVTVISRCLQPTPSGKTYDVYFECAEGEVDVTNAGLGVNARLHYNATIADMLGDIDYSKYAFIDKSCLTDGADAIREKMDISDSFSVAGMAYKTYSFKGETNYSTDGIIFAEVDGGYSITGYEGTASDIYIGSHHNGLPILDIGYKAFFEKSNITSITFSQHSRISSIGNSAIARTNIQSIALPNSVTSFGDDALEGNVKLTSVVVSNRITEIPKGFVRNCCNWSDLPKLTKIVIPDGVTAIGEWAFRNTAIKEAYLPASITEIDPAAFSKNNASSLTIYCDFAEGTVAGAPWGATNANVLYGGNTDGLIFADVTDSSGNVIGCNVTGYEGTETDVIIGGQYNGKPILRIIEAAFSSAPIESVVINGKVEEISFSAFVNCTSLTSVTIGDGVKRIGECAFSGCTALTSIKIPNSVTNVEENAFYGCTSLIVAELGVGCKNMPANVFGDCSTLTTINAPWAYDEVTNAPWGAINTGIVYDENYKTYGLVFEDDGNDGYMVTGFNYDDQKSSRYIYIPSKYNGKPVTAIADSAFRMNLDIASVEIADGITSIGESAFSYCSWLFSVTLPSTINAINKSTFSYCSELTSIVIPNSITVIDDYAFECCNNLTSVTMPAWVSKIGDYAFAWCYSLNAIFIPSASSAFGSSLSPTMFDGDTLDIYVGWGEDIEDLRYGEPWGATLSSPIVYNARSLYNL